ncbi:protein GRAVITROPIC IN THE LIGHT 1 [Apium graveolens]|uniref:protein GRAVITROPIC IN THE LIGHT 1 n=1 Tax=Apium graveolens TaxID=4045 RepID=UPI003D7A0502
MTEMDTSSKQPQISDYFQKFALAFKAKTVEFFAEEEDPTYDDTAPNFTLLDSEEFTIDQKVVVVKPDPARICSSPNSIQPINTHFSKTLISSLFAITSSFEASYLQLQTAQVPFDEEAVRVADKALILQLKKLYEVRNLYKESRLNPHFDFDVNLLVGSCLEAQVQENQSKLRALGTMVNRLQFDIDCKDDEVLVCRKKLSEVELCNYKLSKRLSSYLKVNGSRGTELLLTVRVFESMLVDVGKSMRRFSKLLIGLMRKAGWDLDLAANSVCHVEYAKKEHNKFAFLSYVCLAMFQGFDLRDFGLEGSEGFFDGYGLGKGDSSCMKELLEHVSGVPMEILSRNPKCEFSKFCERKYEQIIHPTMESSIFRNFDHKEVVIDSWKSLKVFYESFVKMASSVWSLHKLAHSFSPVVEIFQVERGVDYSLVYMEDVLKRDVLPGKSRAKAGLTVLPGFRILKTIIQSQVYLTGL